jgi:putative restriction endonuclease
VKYWVAVTDLDWFSYLAHRAPLEEVNFWQPSTSRPINLPPYAPWIFKLAVRHGGWVVGGGYFATYTTMTPTRAWDTFLDLNGRSTLPDLVRSLTRYSERPIDPDTTLIGSNVLVQPFFLPRESWIEAPADWSSNLTRGKAYDHNVGEGRKLWERLQIALVSLHETLGGSAVKASTEAYGGPILIRPRLGQGAFRVMVTDAYERRCAITNERTLPVLEAAHIKPYSLIGTHEVSNGLLLRSDIHTLFDRGYVTVTPDMRFRVSRRIHDEFANGREYYALDDREIRRPLTPSMAPSPEFLRWHSETVFRG